MRRWPRISASSCTPPSGTLDDLTCATGPTFASAPAQCDRAMLLLGFAGLLSFGHAAFLGGAAYATGQALKFWNVSTEVGLLIGIASGAALGFVSGGRRRRAR